MTSCVDDLVPDVPTYSSTKADHIGLATESFMACFVHHEGFIKVFHPARLLIASKNCTGKVADGLKMI